MLKLPKKSNISIRQRTNRLYASQAIRIEGSITANRSSDSIWPHSDWSNSKLICVY